MAVSPRSVVGKLNSACRRALEAAAGLCMSRTHFHVEIEHWLTKLLEPNDTDLPTILRQYDVAIGQVRKELAHALDRMKTGNGRAPDLSPDIVDLAREAWSLASLEYGAPRVRSAHLLLTLLTDRSLSLQLRSASPELAKIPAEKFQKELPELVANSAESQPEP